MKRLNGNPREPRPCVKCGTVFDTRNCAVCARARDLARYHADPELARYKNAAWRNANPGYGAEWRRENRDKSNSYTAQWRIQNPDKVREMTKRRARKPPTLQQRAIKNARSAAWKKANPERAAAAIQAWAKRYPERRRAALINRRAGIKGRVSPDLLTKLLALQRGKCACCGELLGSKFHMDHIMPLAKGGTNTDDNMQLLRAQCNLQKGAKHPVDFMQTRGRLL
jgi:hypothetical protein